MEVKEVAARGARSRGCGANVRSMNVRSATPRVVDRQGGVVRFRGPPVRTPSDVGPFTEAEPSTTRITGILR